MYEVLFNTQTGKILIDGNKGMYSTLPTDIPLQLNFNDQPSPSNYYQTNTQTANAAGTVYVTVTHYNINGILVSVYKNSSLLQYICSSGSYVNQTFSVVTNDTLYFIIQLSSVGTYNGTVTLKRDNSSGEIIDSFNYQMYSPGGHGGGGG